LDFVLSSSRHAVEVLQGYKFDKNHSLQVTRYERACHLRDIETSVFQEPTPSPFEEKPNAAEWLSDANQRDQFLIRHGTETAVYWWDTKKNPDLEYDGAREKEAGVSWCDYYCHWSTAGSYLATLMPPKGVILWSGTDYEKVGRFLARTYHVE
jgi:translation initiation factor 3 subunit B